MDSLQPKGLWWRKPWRKLCRAGSLCWHSEGLTGCWKGIHILLAKSLLFLSYMYICDSWTETLWCGDKEGSCDYREPLPHLPAPSSPSPGQDIVEAYAGLCSTSDRGFCLALCSTTKWNFLGKVPVCSSVPPRAELARSASPKPVPLPHHSALHLEMTWRISLIQPKRDWLQKGLSEQRHWQTNLSEGNWEDVGLILVLTCLRHNPDAIRAKRKLQQIHIDTEQAS